MSSQSTRGEVSSRDCLVRAKAHLNEALSYVDAERLGAEIGARLQEIIELIDAKAANLH